MKYFINIKRVNIIKINKFIYDNFENKFNIIKK